MPENDDANVLRENSTRQILKATLVRFKPKMVAVAVKVEDSPDRLLPGFMK